MDTLVEEDLLPGQSLRGPAIVYARDTTIYLPEGTNAEMDRFRSILMEVG